MTTTRPRALDALAPDPTLAELTDHQAAVDLGARVVERLRGRRIPVQVDIASLHAPGMTGRRTLATSPGATLRYTIRTASGAVFLARTPGGEAPCPSCFDHRWLGARSEQERHHFEDPHGAIHTRASRAGDSLVEILAALIAADAEGADATVPAAVTPVWQVSTTALLITRVALLKDSGCPACSTKRPDTPEGARVVLTPTPVHRPGRLRQLAPEDLALPVEALANPVCGALGPVSMRAYNATATAPTSGQFLVRSKYGLHQMWWSGHAESYARSEILGMLEGLERTAGQLPSAKDVGPRRARWEITSPAVEFEECGLYSDSFYAGHDAKYVRWEDQPVIPWVWGWSLRDNRAIAVPEQLAYYLDHRTDHRNTVQECSNGCASGTSVVEATLHGLLELLERDAFLTSWYAPLAPREIDVDSVGSPLVQHMRTQLDQLGYDLRCFDTRTDIPVPTVGAVAVRRDGGIGRLCFAGGASLDPTDAVRAAVCEVASYVPGFPGRVRDRLELLELAVDDFSVVTELEHHALLFGMPQMERYAAHWLRQERGEPIDEVFADWTRRYRPAGDLADPVRDIVAMLAERGMDTVVVDQTSPEQRALGVSTVATIVPGLVPIDFGWERQRCLAMPRTYTAHFAAGKSPRPFTGGELIAAPHPFP